MIGRQSFFAPTLRILIRMRTYFRGGREAVGALEGTTNFWNTQIIYNNFAKFVKNWGEWG